MSSTGSLGGLLAIHIKRHIAAYLLTFAAFLGGIILGAYAVHTLPPAQKADLVKYVDTYLKGFERTGDISREQLVTHSLFTHGKTLAISYLLGLTVFGAPIVLALLFGKGFIIGFTVGFLVDGLLFKGALLAAAAVLPHNFLVVPAVIALGVQALSFAGGFLRGQNKLGPSVLQRFALYSFYVAFLAVILVGASFVESYVTPVFIELVAKY